MVERKRAEHDVVLPILPEKKNIALFEIDLWTACAQPARDFQRGALLVYRVHRHCRADFSRVVDDKARDIAGTGRQIEHPQLRSRLDPASQKMHDEGRASKVAIELAQVA